jgi:hypothetical protein
LGGAVGVYRQSRRLVQALFSLLRARNIRRQRQTTPVSFLREKAHTRS